MFGGSRAPSVGVLARADSVAGARGGGGGAGGINRPGTAKLGEARSSAPLVLSLLPIIFRVNFEILKKYLASLPNAPPMRMCVREPMSARETVA